MKKLIVCGAVLMLAAFFAKVIIVSIIKMDAGILIVVLGILSATACSKPAK